MTDHYLLMTATPHKGDPENFCLFLALLDRDVYGNIEEPRGGDAAARGPVLPAPDEGSAGHVPRPRDRRGARSSSPSATSAPPTFELDGDEFDFYDALTRYVEDQSIKAAADDSRPRPRARLHDGDAPAPHGIERLRRAPQPGADARQARRRSSTTRKATGRSRSTSALPEDFDELPEDEQQEIIAELEDVVASVDPAALREEISELGKLIDQARTLEEREVESKLVKLQERAHRATASSTTRR